MFDLAVVSDGERPMNEGGLVGLEQTPESTQRADSPPRDGTRKFADLPTPILSSLEDPGRGVDDA